jgi:hypothetical protein
LGSLHEAVDAYLEREPYRVELDFDEKAACHVVYIRVFEDPPLELSLMVGDLLQNLRSALDYLAWQLALLCNTEEELTKPAVARNITFPISRRAEDFASHSLLSFIPEEACAAIKRLQPYQRRDGAEGHALFILNELAKVDRHRVLHASLASLELAHILLDWGDSVDREPYFDLTITADEPFEDGTEIGRVFGLGPDSDMSVNRHPTSSILLTDGFEAVPLRLFGDLCATTGRLISIFKPFFED